MHLKHFGGDHSRYWFVAVHVANVQSGGGIAERANYRGHNLRAQQNDWVSRPNEPLHRTRRAFHNAATLSHLNFKLLDSRSLEKPEDAGRDSLRSIGSPQAQ